MSDISEFKEYHANEADIEKVLHFLRLKDPAATPEDAIAYLKNYAQLIHDAGHVLRDEDLRELYDKFRKGEIDV